MKDIEVLLILITALPYAIVITLFLMGLLEIVNWIYKKYWLEN